MTNKLSFAGLFALLILAASMAHSQGLQTIPVTPHETVMVRVSQHELTRLAMQDGRITDLYGADSQLIIEADPERGQLFLRLRDKDSARPINLFVVDEAAQTYGLILTPADIPAVSILLVPPDQAAPMPPLTGAASMANLGDAKYTQWLKTLMRHLALGTTPPGAARRYQQHLVPLWKEVRYLLVCEILAKDWRGAHYQLTNISKEPLRLAETELVQPDVRAVAIRKLELSPGETTDVYLITQGAR